MRCDRQAQKLAALIDNLLDVTSLTSGHFKLQLEHVDLGEVTRDVIDRFGDELTRSGCDVALCAEGRVHGLWDHLRMDQVVTNLLTNAIKYGSGKPIEISVKMVSDVATLAVRDHGIGIPSESVDRIFGRFERAVSSRAYGGLGLGLYITQQIVDAHGGFVRVESDPGMGSVFTVELPREPDEARLTGSGGCA
jgi:signal transduction histidine kinase